MRILSQLRIGSRRSDLARLQAQMVGQRLGTTSYVYKEAPGDVNLKDPLWKMPEMGVFTSFLRRYLVSNEIDLVVHSWKDLPIQADPETEIVSTLPRADSRDLLLVSHEGLAEAYRTGTLVILSSSPRRKYNLPDFLIKSIPVGPNGERIKNVEFRDVRGNIQTRVTKLVSPDLEEAESRPSGLIVAKAAIDRFLLAGQEMEEFKATGELVRNALNKCLWQVLPLSVNPTAAAQGALAIEMSSRAADALIRAGVKEATNCEDTFASVNEEREILHSYGGGCHQKIGCSILKREFGKVTFLRGETDSAKRPLKEAKIDSAMEIQKTRRTNIVKIGGKDGLQLFDRVVRENAADSVRDAVKSSPPSEGVYVSKSDAVPSGIVPTDFDYRVVWTAGVSSWFALANRGFWVNGTSDGLGESELAAVHLISPGTSKWIKLTHSDTPHVDESLFSKVVATYDLQLKPELDIDSVHNDIYGKTHFFFSSGSAFRGLVRLLPDLPQKWGFVAGCGPGNTLKYLRETVGDNIVVSYNYPDFVRKCTQ